MIHKITIGRNRRDKEWRVVDASWEQLVKRLSKPVRTKETLDQYAKMSKKERMEVKDVGGFVGGPQIHGEGQRTNATLKERSILCIDIDGDTKHGKFPEPEKVIEAMDLLSCSYAIHSTHSSTPERPRLRVVLPLDRTVNADEYAPIALRIAEKIGIEYVDQTCRQMARLMFWPSIPSDAEYFFHSCVAGELSADTILQTYIDWTDVSEYPGSNEALRAAQHRRDIRGNLPSGVVQDPSLKDGLIGAFCATYTIDEAICKFNLPYKPCGHSRYTYTGGSSTGGAVLYNGGTMLYSNHNTDPASLQLCNSFDLVRLHLFGYMDGVCGIDVPSNRLPSYKAMVDLASEDPKTKIKLINKITQQTAAAFDDVPLPDDDDTPTTPIPNDDSSTSSDKNTGVDEEAEAWKVNLKTKGNSINTTPSNFKIILENDPRLKGSLQKDLFANRKVVTRPLPWDTKGTKFPRDWNDTDISNIVVWFSETYEMHTNRSSLLDAIEATLNNHATHPVREWLNSLPQWDRSPRLDTLFIKYLGVSDTRLSRNMTRKHLVAAVARVFEPGCKHDAVLILCGGEGIGKSSIISVLAHGWGMDSNINVGDKDGYQNLVGNWLIEMSELADMEAKSVAIYKSFISSTHDKYRPSYGRETIDVPRQCVFFGTTNEAGFLKGRTGNRRFWVLECSKVENGPERILRTELPFELEQVWAEALYYYRNGEKLALDTTDEEALRTLQESHEDILLDDNKSIIEEFILCQKPSDWEDRSIEQRRNWWKGREDNQIGTGSFYNPIVPLTYEHTKICVKEIAAVVYGQSLSVKSRYEDNNIRYICDHLSCLQKTDLSLRFGKELGCQRAYEVIRKTYDLPY